MTDLEMTKLCAEAMGIETTMALGQLDSVENLRESVRLQAYDPLHNDVQAMALVKRFALQIEAGDVCSIAEGGDWLVYQPDPVRWQRGAERQKSDGDISCNCDLNRAIVECVAALKVRTDLAPVEAS